MSTSFSKIIKLREIEEGWKVIRIDGVFNNHRLISENKFPHLATQITVEEQLEALKVLLYNNNGSHRGQWRKRKF